MANNGKMCVYYFNRYLPKEAVIYFIGNLASIYLLFYNITQNIIHHKPVYMSKNKVAFLED